MEARRTPEYFTRKREEGAGHMLAKAHQMSGDLIGYKWKSILCTA